MPAISALSDLTNRTISAATTVSSSDHEAWRNDLEGRVSDLNDVAADLENNHAGTSAPTDNAVEGKLWADTTNDPAELLFDPDGSGADIRVVMETHTQTLTNKTLTSPTIGGSGFTLSANGWPSFKAHLNGSAQTNITGAQKVAWDTETYDTNSDFDSTTNNRFTPTVAGKYLLIAQIGWSTFTASDSLRVFIYKNGSSIARQLLEADNTFAENHSVQVIDDANGSTDYYEVFAENAARDTSSVAGLEVDSFFCGSRIA